MTSASVCDAPLNLSITVQRNVCEVEQPRSNNVYVTEQARNNNLYVTTEQPRNNVYEFESPPDKERGQPRNNIYESEQTRNINNVYMRDVPEQTFKKFQAGCTVWSSQDTSSLPRGALVMPMPVIATTSNNAHVHNLWSAQDSSSADESLSTSPPPPLLERLQQVPLTPPRPRGPKHPVPEELKDERYFKRRRRNNEAAKRSRRARKERQDADMQRISEAESENASLRMQLLQLRAEYDTLAQLLMRRQTLYFHHPALVPPHDN